MIKEKNTIKDKLTTDYYRVLEILYKNQTTIGEKTFSPITQNEIAEELHLHKMTINAIFRELKEDGLVILDFKTDRTDDRLSLKVTYGEQLNIYAVAAEKIFKKPVKQKIIYSFFHKKEIEV